MLSKAMLLKSVLQLFQDKLATKDAMKCKSW